MVRELTVSLVIAAAALSTAPAHTTTQIPFISNGALGSLNPSSNVIFDTDNLTYTIGSQVNSGGVAQSIGSNLGFSGASVAVFNFSSFNLPTGVTVYARGTRPLVITSVAN